ncbi:MAG: hypothetical protein HXY25_00560 [Alphaproteobacteria bacterium]|nr:hypothetical protein [Alphaproteobacteria bacterium]
MPRGRGTGTLRAMRILALVFGLVLIFGGIVWMLLPVPLGLFAIGLGVALVLWASPQARAVLRWLRGLAPGLDRLLRRTEARLPREIATPLERTEPSGLEINRRRR